MTQITVFSNDAHRADVVRLWHDVFGHATGHNAPGLSIDRKLALADGLFFVALDGGRVVGTVMAGYDGHRGWLYSVAVAPRQQKRGIGAALVVHAEKALAARGCMKVNLQVLAGNEAVTGFYEALGFAVEPRVSMGKLITANIPASAMPEALE
jgi:ribosomal protein S18 acetylase RimI-like enzyme